MVSVDYKENSNAIVVTILKGRKPVVRTTTLKATNITTIDVFKEGSEEIVETYVYNKV